MAGPDSEQRWRPNREDRRIMKKHKVTEEDLHEIGRSRRLVPPVLNGDFPKHHVQDQATNYETGKGHRARLRNLRG